MKQARFINEHQPFWVACEHAIDVRHPTMRSLPEDYQRLSHHLAVAQTREYSDSLIRYLENLVFQYHRKLYAGNRRVIEHLWHFFRHSFPVSVRQHHRVILIASALFFVPLVILPLLIWFDNDLVYYFLDSNTMSSVQSMYDPANRVLGRERADDSNWMMFGYYIYNNTGIGFRTFATGLLLGVGSGFFLLYNGIFIGAITGYIIMLGYNETFFSFVAGHSAFELTAIALSGGAGLTLGHALLKPGTDTRLHALQKSAGRVMPVMLGAMAFFFIAAAVEAFWSPDREFSLLVKATVGIILWILVLGYFLLVGEVTDET